MTVNVSPASVATSKTVSAPSSDVALKNALTEIRKLARGLAGTQNKAATQLNEAAAIIALRVREIGVASAKETLIAEFRTAYAPTRYGKDVTEIKKGMAEYSALGAQMSRLRKAIDFANVALDKGRSVADAAKFAKDQGAAEQQAYLDKKSKAAQGAQGPRTTETAKDETAKGSTPAAPTTPAAAPTAPTAPKTVVPMNTPSVGSDVSAYYLAAAPSLAHLLRLEKEAAKGLIGNRGAAFRAMCDAIRAFQKAKD